jgi:hypothetical protein
VHIQDDIEIEGVSRNESVAFSDDICRWALKLNVEVLRYVSGPLRRPEHIEGYVQPLLVPSP